MSVLIAGGGIAGAAAACLLGPAATLVEREAAAHDKICGEFVSWEAQDGLARLGLDLPSLGGASIHSVRLVHGPRSVTTALPHLGLGLSRRVLDEALLGLAVQRGARLHRGHAVRRITPDGALVDGLGRLPVGRVLLATGKHDLHAIRRPATGEPLVGLKMYFALSAAEQQALDGHVEVVLFPGGYAGLQMVEGRRANLCLLIQHAAFREAGGNWPGILAHLRRHAPHLARRLAGAEALLAQPVTIFRVPYGFVHRPGADDPAHVARLGDQMGVIPSFSGDGMAIALHTAFAAARGPGAAAYHARMRTDLAGQIGRAMLLHRLGQARPGWVAAAARAWPGAMGWVARLTRVPVRRLAWQ
ncbi:MAG: NAD(P)/FAD-dependent oxidoreductase [Janthinobacterium lividum]